MKPFCSYIKCFQIHENRLVALLLKPYLLMSQYQIPTTTFIFSTGSIGVFFKYSSMHRFVYIISPTLQAGNIFLPTPTWRLSIVAEVCTLQNYKEFNTYMALKKGGFELIHFA